MNKSEEVDSIYHDFGKFLIEFEQLVLSIKINIITFFSLNGLNNEDYIRVVLQDQTAFPLNNKLKSLISIHYKDRPEKFKLIDKLFIHTNKLIEKRNFVIHGSSFVGSENMAELFKDKIGKFGLKVEEEVCSKEDMNELVIKVILAKHKFDNLRLCLFEPDRDLNKYFSEEQLAKLKI